MKLDWKNPRIDGWPTSRRRCFVEVSGKTIELATYNGLTGSWSNSFGTLSKVYDDSGCVYDPPITRWAYIPDGLFEEAIEICSAYQKGFYKFGDACFGTKEKDPCSCGGDKRKCDFYD